MSNPYISSIVTKYGDLDNVKRDVQALKDIQSRQGSSLLIDSLAEYAASALFKFKSNEEERMRLVDSLVSELRNALLERTENGQA